jgi:hypothetical protein
MVAVASAESRIKKLDRRLDDHEITLAKLHRRVDDLVDALVIETR